MKRHVVVFTPEARSQLLELYRRIALNASPAIAARYTDALVSRCEALAEFPERGSPRDDVRPGLRITHYRRRTVIAFAVDADQVAIIGLFHGGQDYTQVLGGEEPA